MTRLRLPVLAAVAAAVSAGPGAAAPVSPAAAAKAVVLAHAAALRKGDWKAVCGTLDRAGLASNGSSVAACASEYPYTIRSGNGFEGDVYDGGAKVTRVVTKTLDANRVKVFTLWWVGPWNQYSVLEFAVHREFDRGQKGAFRIVSQTWVKRLPAP